ncbi:MAG TPA: capsule assembly Wzi family protein, partial [Longimicrobium sp.]|nr:capsule assembly Wzi family protein [Longimicrobium sp.]
EDRHRIGQLLGEEPTAGYLLRTLSGTAPAPRGVSVVLPEARVVWNSALPFSLNQGGMVAGRGSSVRLSGGVRAERGALSLTLVPVLITEENASFDLRPYSEDQSRHELSSPWHWGTESADLPSRFGRSRRNRMGLGESSVSARAGAVRGGASTESQWWGPGVRNALVMSNNAGGFPHLFLGTSRPVRTRLGSIEGRWIVGRLSESAYFDTLSNDQRTLAGIVATLQPAFDEGLTVGVSRTVYGPSGSPLRAFDVFRGGIGHPNVIDEDAPPPDPDAPLPGYERDQVFAVFARWVFPAAGLEAYGEVARTDEPSSLRDLLVEPQRTQGYTLGLQWARPAREGIVRFQGEATMLEQTDRYGKRLASFYSSRTVPQGYTHRGQVLGAAIGPGASSQWAAADFIRPEWRAGAVAARIRWENDALYRLGPTRNFHSHDVSTLLGARGGRRVRGMDVSGELLFALRRNYLFQNVARRIDDVDGVDIRNRTLTLAVSPAPRRAPPAPAPARVPLLAPAPSTAPAQLP